MDEDIVEAASLNSPAAADTSKARPGTRVLARLALSRTPQTAVVEPGCSQYDCRVRIRLPIIIARDL